MRWWTTNRAWLVIVMTWLILASLLSVAADSSKEHTSPIKNNGLPEHESTTS